ncbi:hypothetical protein CPB83DRAFT_759774 [Crepidotus variabilis]|uniref:JmjC domain-containing protein n=1 Tax=Crepidotus variabilis TaxID=179855 RepID=A0A9P6ENL5_9AGAR|nr:hypothetical protein CPB83DRAFT_759774 [Crepidotus variabilis]
MSQASASSTELRTLRRVYTDAAILRALIQSLRSQTRPAIATLDHSIIIAGPYGRGRLELVLDIIHRLQGDILRGSPDAKSLLTAAQYVDNIPDCKIISPITPPSFLQFKITYSRRPFILRGYAKNWPALTHRPWRSHAYLSSVAGPGRVIPVEVGNDYRAEDWQQKIMQWDEYLTFLDFEDRPSSRSNSNAPYMAQHDLLKQFPKLQNDIVIPDYLYADLESQDFPSYQSPANEDKRILNAWLGPEGAVSPAHTDPYFNFYAQVVGHKKVWLAPPSISNSMYSFAISDEDSNNDRHSPSSALKNTSRVDVFADAEDMKQFPAFLDQVVPVSLTAMLSPGDVLFFPPGWWHAMKSESTSFSISMWF